MKERTKQYAVIVVLLFLGLGYYSFYEGSGASSSLQLYEAIEISDERARHILYGDERGGGHRYGAGVPCKSEFPSDWSDEHILSTIREIAVNDNLTWERANNGYYVAEDVRGDVEVRVVLGPKKRRVITGYPVNLPRNPCPVNDP